MNLKKKSLWKKVIALSLAFSMCTVQVPAADFQEESLESSESESEIIEHENSFEEVEVPAELVQTSTSDFETTYSYILKYTGNEKHVRIPSTDEFGKRMFPINFMAVDTFKNNLDTIESISVPAGMGFHSWIFNNIRSLEKIEIASNHDDYKSINGVLYDKNVQKLYCYPQNKKDSYYAPPETVNMVEEDTLQGRKIQIFRIPLSWTKTTYAMLKDCKLLKKVEIPKGSKLRIIRDETFNGCSSLKEIVLPETLEEIGYKAFANCTSLTHLWIPKKVAYIHYQAFSGCKNLTIHGVKGSYAEKFAKQNGYKFSTSKNVNVVSVEKISLDKKALSLTVGASKTLKLSISPSNASNKKVTWKSSNKTIATVNSSGKVTAKKPGTVTITVTTNDGKKKATCRVSVEYKITYVLGANGINHSKNPKSYVKSGTEIKLYSPTRYGYIFQGWYKDKNYKTKVTKIKAGETGDKTFYAKWNRIKVYVNQINFRNDRPVKVTKGDEIDFSKYLTIVPENAESKAVVWKSMNPEIATISSKGVVKAVSPGEANIRVIATDRGTIGKTIKINVISLFDARISMLRERFPRGSYWNHEGYTNAQLAEIGRKYGANVDEESAIALGRENCVTSHPCTHHAQGICETGQSAGLCGCNGFYRNGKGSSQCDGFAMKLSEEIFGSDFRTEQWEDVEIDLNKVQSGDVVRGVVGGYPHTFLVLSVAPDQYCVADCNSDGKCIIRWNDEISKSNISSVEFIRRATNVNEILY